MEVTQAMSPARHSDPRGREFCMVVHGGPGGPHFIIYILDHLLTKGRCSITGPDVNQCRCRRWPRRKAHRALQCHRHP